MPNQPKFRLTDAKRKHYQRMQYLARKDLKRAAKPVAKKCTGAVQRARASSPVGKETIISPPPPPPSDFVNMLVRKKFDGDNEYVTGIVESYDPRYKWWKIKYLSVYEDGHDEMNLGQLKRVLLDATSSTRVGDVDQRTWITPWHVYRKKVTIKGLNLFSGCQTVERMAEKWNRQFNSSMFEIEIVSLDKEAHLHARCASCDAAHIHSPTIVGDISDWMSLLKKYKRGDFHFIWASCECRYFSQANNQTKTHKNTKQAVSQVRSTLECIDFFSGTNTVFFLENPAFGDLSTHRIMAGLERYRHIVSFCRYSGNEGRAKKDTSIWTNCPGMWDTDGESVLLRCAKHNLCPAKRAGFAIHGDNGQLGPSSIDPPGLNRGAERTKLYQVPLQLLEILLGKVIQFVVNRILLQLRTAKARAASQLAERRRVERLRVERPSGHTC